MAELDVSNCRWMQRHTAARQGKSTGESGALGSVRITLRRSISGSARSRSKPSHPYSTASGAAKNRSR